MYAVIRFSHLLPGQLCNCQFSQLNCLAAIEIVFSSLQFSYIFGSILYHLLHIHSLPSLGWHWKRTEMARRDRENGMRGLQ